MEREKSGGSKRTDTEGIYAFKNFIPGLENIKKIKNKQSLVVILIIIGIILVTLPGNDKAKTTDANNEETEISSILSEIEGVGEVSVVITYYQDEKNRVTSAKGAIVTAEGAGDMKIKNDISQAVQAALDLPAHKVKVYKNKKY